MLHECKGTVATAGFPRTPFEAIKRPVFPVYVEFRQLDAKWCLFSKHWRIQVMDRPQKRTNLVLASLLVLSSLVGCAYHNLHGGGNSCGSAYGGAPGTYQPGSGAAAYPQGGGPAPYYQAPARPPGSGFFGSGGY